MPERSLAFQAIEFLRAEDLGHETHVAMQLESGTGAVARDDAGAFLAPMLEREEPVIGEDRRVIVTEDRKNPALVLGISQRGMFRGHRGFERHRIASIR